MTGLGFDGVSPAVRRLRQRFSPTAVILLYHWVCEVETLADLDGTMGGGEETTPPLAVS
jgi:hypothetical protein